MASPAQRYAAARERRQAPRLQEFAASYPFALDPFQREACAALEAGEGVLVAAPTGAGKTVVGEFAVHLALSRGRKCFYTTPIKALSNQKYADLVARHGPQNVGLLTGDTARNGDAPIVVMTTEVLRNMLYAGSSAVHGLDYVVMDEVHYLSDRFRGAVWEEVIIHLPASVTLVSLSATVSNAEEFGEWLQTVRGTTRVVVEEHRPVPLWQHVLAGATLYDLFSDDAGEELNPALVRLAREEGREPWQGRRRRPAAGRYAPGRRPRVPVANRVEVLGRLDSAGLLPSIYFVFSRAGCDAALAACLRAGVRLCSPAERLEVREVVEERTAELPEEELRVLGYPEWAEALERGVAAHHAGLLPAFKEVVEELFTRGLIKVVFATETLALGINMPARSVVLERLRKWNGEAHADITPGEYTQLTGRAGRRGIDIEGHAVVLWGPDFDPAAVAGLASARTYPLRSSFRPTYNMAVNLTATVGRDKARLLLEQSFAQFQADRGVVGLARQLRRQQEALAGYADAARCERGDLVGYLELRRALSARESVLARERAAERRTAAAAALAELRVGDVVDLRSGRRVGPVVVVATGESGPVVVTAQRQARRINAADLTSAPVVLGRIRVPKGFAYRSAQARRDLVASLHAQGLLDRPAVPRSPAGEDAEVARLRAALRAHPCHGCPEREEHARSAERQAALRRDTDALEARVAGRTGTLARTFDRVCAVLSTLGYLDAADEVTGPGRSLARIYAESDLVVVECLHQGLWDRLSPAGLAAVLSLLVYGGRHSNQAPVQQPPVGVADTLARTTEVWARLRELEAEHSLDTLHVPDPGFSWAAYRWASGSALGPVLEGAELAAGDFVRWCKQIIDLADQITGLPDSAVADTARLTVTALRRGVVAYAS